MLGSQPPLLVSKSLLRLFRLRENALLSAFDNMLAAVLMAVEEAIARVHNFMSGLELGNGGSITYKKRLHMASSRILNHKFGFKAMKRFEIAFCYPGEKRACFFVTSTPETPLLRVSDH